jgi:hypothetical protein
MAGDKKGQQHSHFKDTHKYEKQRIRTARNKARNIAKAKLLYDIANQKEK